MIFLKEKPSQVLIVLKENPQGKYLSEIAKQAQVTFPYIAQLSQILVAKGIATLETKGKFRVMRLTEKGSKLAAIVDEVWKLEKE